ncbi:response regulator [Xylophilus rhododendri]|uniref:Response regulator n=1 Tax=Xylophilus rhododendri TaxID=2697032 RepID=A0A857J1F4_9BURK|nr:response regulator [Xylophilus rhododendri]QHI97073.1 response regulator [Xylophilus rhododendri]
MNTPVAVVVEDEPQIRTFIRSALEQQGWTVHEAATAERGIVEAGTRKPDLLVLDLGLPDADGVSVIEAVRAWSTVAILVLSARSDEQDKIRALDAGADDYLTKPFGMGELMARLRAIRRRPRPGGDGAAESALLRFGDVELDLAARQVRRAGTQVHLTPIEFRLLSTLAAHAGRVLTHRQLLLAVWGPAHAEQTHYTRIYMGNLRKKLEADPAQPRHFLSENAVGYRLVL